MVNFNLFLTARCNWKCDYCFRTDTSVMKNIDPETDNRILKFSPVIAKLTNNVLFTGGELGTMKPEILEFLFETFKGKTIRLATNGGWFKTPSFKKYKDLDDLHILYHCVEDLYDEIEFPKVDVPRIKYDFVITEDNLKDVPQFIKRYPNLTFYPILDLRRSKTLFNSFYQEVYNIIQKYDNIPPQIKRAIQVMASGDKSYEEDIIRNKPFRYRVDFNSNNITSCCIPTIGVELTEKNLKLVSEKKIILPVDNRICSYCVIRWLNKSDDIKNPIKS